MNTEEMQEKIARALHAHWVAEPGGGTATESWTNCTCGIRITVPGGTRDEAWRRGDAHQAEQSVAAVLPIVEAEVRKARAEALRGAADLIEDMRNSAQVAEVAAYVPGEVGRQNVIDSFEAAMEEPGDWLRSLADSGEADTYREDRVNAWLAEAWDEGRDALALALASPLGEGGLRRSPTNPHREEPTR